MKINSRPVCRDRWMAALRMKREQVDAQVALQLAKQMDEAEKLLLSVARPKTTYRIMERESIQTKGFSIEKHLEGCHKVIVMAATLGIGVDTLLRKTQITDMALAVVIDSGASVLIEQVCDDFEQQIRRHLQGSALNGDPKAAGTDTCGTGSCERNGGIGELGVCSPGEGIQGNGSKSDIRGFGVCGIEPDSGSSAAGTDACKTDGNSAAASGINACGTGGNELDVCGTGAGGGAGIHLRGDGREPDADVSAKPDAGALNTAEQPQIYVTSRFSPGYGDFPLTEQSRIIGYLDAQRQIGLHVTADSLMIPGKSVTALMGIADHPVTGRLATCNECVLKEKCTLRKEGKFCGD